MRAYINANSIFIDKLFDFKQLIRTSEKESGNDIILNNSKVDRANKIWNSTVIVASKYLCIVTLCIEIRCCQMKSVIRYNTRQIYAIKYTQEFSVLSFVVATWPPCQIRKIVTCACRNVFPTTAGLRSRHASRHMRHARAVMHAGIIK